MENKSNIVVIYHKDCVDGTTAAAVVLKKYPRAQPIPLSHDYVSDDITSIFSYLPSDTIVYTVDCALGVQDLLEKGYTVVTIDHHIGIKEIFEILDRDHEEFTFIFDNEKSGASLTWEYFFSDETMPEIVKYVEDVDLWRWKYGDTSRYVSLYLSIFRNAPEKVSELLSGNTGNIIGKGETIAEFVEKEVEQQLKLEPIKVQIIKTVLDAYNITVHQSVCGNQLAEIQGNVSVLYTISGNKVKMSFRSKEGQEPSALSLAESLGGGGHEKAAGATIGLSQFLDMIVR